MTIHYHGTPLTPRTDLERMKGKNFCVSFANPNDVGWCMANGQSVMLDNGAFVFYRSKKRAKSWSKFYDWAEVRSGHPHWTVVPDVKAEM